MNIHSKYIYKQIKTFFLILCNIKQSQFKTNTYKHIDIDSNYIT